MAAGDPEFVDELIHTFYEDAVTQLEAMRQAAAAGSGEALVRPAHSLKGNSATVGAGRLSELCQRLEADARSGVVDDVIERVAEAAAEFEQVRKELAGLRAR
jgi:HPt (histidine-containing phosphotransfer) domain-containing protein